MAIFLPKIKKNFFDDSLTFEKMYGAFIRARENKSNKSDVMFFEEKTEENIVKLIKELQSGTYRIGKYTEFYVYKPKKRVIKTLPFRDRVVISGMYMNL